MPAQDAPNTERLCRECGTVYTSDPGRICADCLADVAEREPGSISQEQRRQIAALLLIREPVARIESMQEFITGVLGPDTFGPNSSLWELSAKQGGDLLEALENERQAARSADARGRRGVDYQGHRRGDARRRPTQGAHRAQR